MYYNCTYDTIVCIRRYLNFKKTILVNLYHNFGGVIISEKSPGVIFAENL